MVPRYSSRAGWCLSKDAAYVHMTANETIHGVEFRQTPDVGDVPLFADFSSSIAADLIDVSKYDLIYAGAQKNLGPVGICVVIARRTLLERTGQPRADIFTYASHAARDSMLNTPPTFNWYLLGLTVKWMLDEGECRNSRVVIRPRRNWFIRRLINLGVFIVMELLRQCVRV